jgi:hypothetical protein
MAREEKAMHDTLKLPARGDIHNIILEMDRKTHLAEHPNNRSAQDEHSPG